MLVEEGSLYPALYRLERRGWVEAEWGTSELGRRAKLYRLTEHGPRAARRRDGHLAAVLRRRLEDPVRQMKRSLRSWLWRVPLDQEVDEELAFHLEMRTRELVARGMDPQRARELALSGSAISRRLKRTCVDLGRKRDRDMRVTQWLEELRDDVKFAFRQLRSAPASRASPPSRWRSASAPTARSSRWSTPRCSGRCRFREPDRLVTIWERTATSARSGVSPLNMLDWKRAQPHVRDRSAGSRPTSAGW